jgi:D-proline reductase (dithiol) PrdB
VPVLAQTFEAAGLSVVLVTNMPYWAEAMGVARTIGVEFPYGHQLGMPNDPKMQLTVIHAALALLEEATEPGTVRELDIEWPQVFDEAKKDWQPLEPSPIVARLIEQRRKAAEQARQQGGGSSP